MTEGEFHYFHSFIADAMNGVFDLERDTLKVMLTNTKPSPLDRYREDIEEIEPGNGYRRGGEKLHILYSSQEGGIYSLIPREDVVFTPKSRKFIGPFRYVVLYDDTAHRNNLIGWWEYGFSVQINLGTGPFRLDLDNETPLIQASFE